MGRLLTAIAELAAAMANLSLDQRASLLAADDDHAEISDAGDGRP